MRVWRLCRARHAATAFSGEGARLASARWNSEGVAMAYAAEHLSLAVLEVFVHLSAGERPQDFMSVAAEIAVDAGAYEKAKREMLASLPANWRFDHKETHAVGDAWARARGSLLLPVPSVIIEGEWNALVNPQHPDARKVTVLETKPFRFDARMFK
jgi:RES domain-containing protein